MLTGLIVERVHSTPCLQISSPIEIFFLLTPVSLENCREVTLVRLSTRRVIADVFSPINMNIVIFSWLVGFSQEQQRSLYVTSCMKEHPMGQANYCHDF